MFNWKIPNSLSNIFKKEQVIINPYYTIDWDLLNFLHSFTKRDLDEVKDMIRARYPDIKMIINETDDTVECQFPRNQKDGSISRIKIYATHNKVYQVQCEDFRGKFLINSSYVHTF